MGVIALSQEWPRLGKKKILRDRDPELKEVVDGKFGILKKIVMECEPYSCYKVTNVITLKTL